MPTHSRAAESFYVFNKSALLVLVSCAVGCSGLLDIPEDPRLVTEPGGVVPAPTEPVRSVPERSANPPAEAPSADVSTSRPPKALPQPIAANVQDTASAAGEGAAGEGAAGQVVDITKPDAGAALPGPVVTPPEPERAPPACAGPESLGPSGNCYLASTARVSWLQARQRCREYEIGWELASIRSDETNQFIGTLGVDEAWIGASDAQLEGTWAWVDDGAPFWRGTGTTGRALNGAYERWLGDEPNGGLGSACARFVTIALEARLAAPAWADLECSESLAFVCEGPAR